MPYALTGSYGTRETILADNAPAIILYIISLLSGFVIANQSHVLLYTQIEFPDEPGRFESYTCGIIYD